MLVYQQLVDHGFQNLSITSITRFRGATQSPNIRHNDRGLRAISRDAAAALSWQRRDHLALHHAVAHDDDERDDPAKHRLGSAERRHQQRDRDERPDADHVDHVEGGGLEKAEPAVENRQ